MWVVGLIARALLLTAELVMALPLLYLLILSVGALLESRSPARPTPASAEEDKSPRFALLIPAHNEAAVIADALASLAALDYPAARRAIFVVADNCTDDTARIARAAGVTVYERFSDDQRAKGYALRWLLERLAADRLRFDAYVVVDADSHLSPNFLRRMADTLAAGALVAQAQYRVLNGADGWTAGLRAVAFALFNHLRPLGRKRFGWSAGLKGNGMCFSASVFERFGWQSYSLAEDAEYHLQLIGAGVQVAYVPDAIVSSAMPTTLRQAHTQQARWERGRIELARAHLGPLMRDFLRHRDLASLDAGMEILLPPLSLVVGAILLCGLLAALLRWAPTLALALALALALGAHVLVGAVLARLSIRAYLSLLRAPLYIAWKCWVYLAALVMKGSGRWVRTERAGARAKRVSPGTPVA
jgi:cellulose synthase/poly-beta-1,6-N-acetylglucosamine synthase-like glycosyltransferase